MTKEEIWEKLETEFKLRGYSKRDILFQKINSDYGTSIQIPEKKERLFWSSGTPECTDRPEFATSTS